MTDETIVAVYDTAAHAAAAVSDLEAAGVPSSAISQHAKGGLTSASTENRYAASGRVLGELVWRSA